MRAARVSLTYELLARAINLPCGNEIVAVVPQSADEVGGRRLTVVVSGDDMPKHIEGDHLVDMTQEFVR